MAKKAKKTAHEVAVAKLALAERMVASKQQQMKRLVTSLTFWERRASYYAKRVVATANAPRASRAIALGADAPLT